MAMQKQQSNRSNAFPAQNQRGVVLVASLIILLIMTLVGVSSMRTTILEERMTGAMQDQNRAFQAAESALRDAERYFQDATLDDFNNENGLYKFNADELPVWHGSNQRPGTGGFMVYSVNRPGTGSQPAALPDVARQPEYFIEKYKDFTLPGESLELRGLTESDQYRVTTRGFGANENTIIVLRSTYRR